MPTRLARTAQLDFSAGAWKESVARHLVSSRGVWDIENGLLDDDGSIYRRGGSEYLSTSALGSSLRFLWDGRLTAGQRTVIANPDDFGVLDGSEAPVNLGLAGLTLPKRAVEVGGVLFIGGGTMYAGSRKTAVYNTGTVSVTQGSKTVTGAGTTWNTLTDAGMMLRLAGRVYPVQSIESTTSLTLRDPYVGATAAGQAYTLNHIFTATGAVYRVSDLYAVAAGRLFSLEGRFAYFTPPDSPHSFAATDYHELPEGAEIVGGAGLGNRLLLFATNGMWTIDGLDFDLIDASANQQHIVRHADPDRILLNHEGLTTWAGRLVAPCTDGVWLVDGIGEPVKVSTAFDGLWRRYVAAGYRVGLSTVIRSHLFLPIIDSSGVVQDNIVVRLDRAIQTSQGVVRPWSRLADYGGNVAAWAVRSGGVAAARNPQLLGGSVGNGRVLKCNSFFSPSAAVKSEADGSTHRFTVDLPDRPAKDGLGLGTVRKVRARYELEDAGSDDPRLTAAYSTGAVDLTGVALWDVALWDVDVWPDPEAGEWVSLPGTAPEDDGREPYTWRLTAKCRYFRFRLRLSAPAAKMVLRSIEIWSRPDGKA